MLSKARAVPMSGRLCRALAEHHATEGGVGRVLRRALEQLEDLITSEGGSDLPVLRTRIIESLALRTASQRTETDPGTLQSIYGVEVLETSHSAFDEVARGWRTTGMPNH